MPLHEELKETENRLEQAKGQIAAIANQQVALSKDIENMRDKVIPALIKQRDAILPEIEALTAELEKRKNERSVGLDQRQKALDGRSLALDDIQSRQEDRENIIAQDFHFLKEREAKVKHDEENIKSLGDALNKGVSENNIKQQTLDVLITEQQTKIKELEEKTAILKQKISAYESKKVEAEGLVKTYQNKIDEADLIRQEAEGKMIEAGERFAALNSEQAILDQQQAVVDEKLKKAAEADNLYQSQLTTLNDIRNELKLFQAEVNEKIRKNKIEMDLKNLSI